MANWIADRRLYLDKDGKVVEADDPTRVTLLIHQGQSMPEADARLHGLVVDEDTAASATEAARRAGLISDQAEKAAGKPPQNKAITPPENKTTTAASPSPVEPGTDSGDDLDLDTVVFEPDPALTRVVEESTTTEERPSVRKGRKEA